MQTKKELKEAYRQMKFRMGVFQIRNLVNNKVYIDSSVNLDAIWNRHKMQLSNGMHPNTALQNDWNQFGPDNFVYEIIGEIKEKEGETTDYTKEVKDLADIFIDDRQPFDEKGYNNIKKG